MRKSFGHTVLECILDLGVTVVYAVIVGLFIVAIVASDDGPASLMKSILYASLLPASVVMLIMVDLVLRLVAEGREVRRRSAPAIVHPS